LQWAKDYEGWSKDDWRRKCIWGDEVTVERGGGKRQRWIFHNPNEKWSNDYMMSGCFMGRNLGMFIPVFPDPTFAWGSVTSKSLIKEFEIYFMDVWEAALTTSDNGEVYFIIDNARVHGPLKDWLTQRGVQFKNIPPYSPDLNPIEHIWSLVKNLLQRFYPELYKFKGPVEVVKKQIEDIIIHCWDLLSPEIFEQLAETMVHRVKAVIEADGWYTKY
ncbi:hypothetical protein L873DRAFT_1886488, partial [Choiromyces venosus 120613-1]